MEGGPLAICPSLGRLERRMKGTFGQGRRLVWGRAEGKVARQKRDRQRREAGGAAGAWQAAPSPCVPATAVRGGGGRGPGPPFLRSWLSWEADADGTCRKGHCSRGLKRCPMKSQHGPRTPGRPRGPWGDLGESPCPHQHPGHRYGQGPPPDGKTCPSWGFQNPNLGSKVSELGALSLTHRLPVVQPKASPTLHARTRALTPVGPLRGRHLIPQVLAPRSGWACLVLQDTLKGAPCKKPPVGPPRRTPSPGTEAPLPSAPQ